MVTLPLMNEYPRDHTHLFKGLESNLHHTLCGLSEHTLGAIVRQTVLLYLTNIQFKLLTRLVHTQLAILEEGRQEEEEEKRRRRRRRSGGGEAEEEEEEEEEGGVAEERVRRK